MSDRLESVSLAAALVCRGMAEDLPAAKRMIRAGQVLVEGAYVRRPGMRIGKTAAIETEAEPCPYPSRAGLKLEAAIRAFRIAVPGRTCLDVGSGKGGFAACLLRHRARRVLCVDILKNFLSPELAEDPRLERMPGSDVRQLPSAYDGRFELITVDVTEARLCSLIPRCARLLGAGGRTVCLLKPQWETAARRGANPAVCKDPAEHRALIEVLCRTAEAEGLCVTGACPSPILGSGGHREYLFCLQRAGETEKTFAIDPEALVTGAFSGEIEESL